MSAIHGENCSLKLEEMFFREISFNRRTDNISNYNYCPSFKKDIKTLSENRFLVSLEFGITNDKNEFTANVILNGIFVVECPDERISDYLNNNAIAILFPYVRSQMTLLTAQPNFQTVVLPPININALLSEQTSE